MMEKSIFYKSIIKKESIEVDRLSFHKIIVYSKSGDSISSNQWNPLIFIHGNSKLFHTKYFTVALCSKNNTDD